MMKKKTKKQILLGIGPKLEKIFIGVNNVSPELAAELVACIRDLESVTGPLVKDEAIKKSSQHFADEHKDFCMEISKRFEARGLQHFIHISDQMGSNTISYGIMDDNVMMKSISGAMIMSKFIFQGVLKELGMPEHCIDCMTNAPLEMKEGYELKADDMPQRLKHLLEEKFGGTLVGMGTLSIPKDHLKKDEDEDDSHEGKTGSEGSN